MKKILILLFIPLLLSGCYDYNELNDLAIVSGIGIDYEDNEYKVIFEIVSTKKEGESGGSGSSSTYNVSASGSTVAEAFANNGSNMDKVGYFDHIETVVINEEIAKNHLEDVAEYLVRGSKIRNEFVLVIAKDTSAEDIIKATSKEKPIAATFIVDMLRYSESSNSAGYYVPFTKILGNILTGGEDAMVSVVSLDDKDIIMEGMAVFKDFKLAYIFDNNDAAILNMLNNYQGRTVFFEHKCGEQQQTVISIYESKLEIAPANDKLMIKGVLNARINEENCGYDLKSEDAYKELQTVFKQVIEEDIRKVINKLKLAESNALNIGKAYYNKYRKPDYFKWLNQNIEFDLNLKVNKKGLIFQVAE